MKLRLRSRTGGAFAASIATALLVAMPAWPDVVSATPGTSAAPLAGPALLDAIQRRAFAFFWNETDPHTGLTKDRANDFAPDTYTVASIASTGYALAALPVGVEHGWVSRRAAYERALRTLRFVHDEMPNVHGWYYHFADRRTGGRVWKCEVSSIDTGLLLLGALCVGNYFHDTPVQRLADDLYARADFRWMQASGGGGARADAPLRMGWTPEHGWLAARWSDYSEGVLLYLLGMGASSHPIAPSAWAHLQFTPTTDEGYAVLRGPGPLFLWQMPPGWIDFRGQRDIHGIDFWVNCVNAHWADHAYCTRRASTSRTYSTGIWGITASDEPPPAGYGAEADADGQNDGTVAPSAMIAGFLCTPDLTRPSLDALYARYQDRLWGRYGFSDAFNVDRSWYDRDVIGIDLGMTLVALEDARTRLIWRLLGRVTGVRRGMRAAAFRVTAESGVRGLLVRSQGRGGA
jgi:hypothetical protein